MAHLSISLLGTCRITLDGEPVTTLESDKVRGLLAYLAVEDRRPHRREALATLLWPDAAPQNARQNLRRALYNLRQALEGHKPEGQHLDASRQTIELKPASDYWLDVGAFQALYQASQSHPHRSLDACPACIEHLGQAVALYRGDFLAGLSLPNSDSFEEWRLFKQEALHGQVLEALTHLAAYYERRRDYGAAASHLRRQIELEPWREESHRQLMQVLALQGDRSAALQQYETCHSILARELGIEPDTETRVLYERIAVGDLDQALIEAQNPYKGLRAFTEADAADFFGREAFVRRLAGAVRQQAVTVVMGASGSGKSSVLQAGLLPHLRSASIPWPRDPEIPANSGAARDTAAGPGWRPASGQATGDGWIISTLRPGDRPFQRLAEALLPYTEPQLSADRPDFEARARSVAQQLRDGNLALAGLVGPVLGKAQEGAPGERRLLLVVDQLEELFIDCPQPDVRRAFIDCLLQPGAEDAATEPWPPNFSLLISLRADFAAQALAYRNLAEAIQASGLVLGPMMRNELQRAIEEPAHGQGIVFEPGLLERLLYDAGEEPGNLPLVQFTLTLLWDQQTGGQLTHAAYAAIGGLDGALTCYADSVYEGLSPAEREDARRVFTQLVRPGEGTEDTRRRATRVELGDDWELVRKLADARMVVTDRDPAGQEIVELVHEALIHNWLLLQAWMEADRAFHTWHRRLRAARRQWEASGRDEGALLLGAPLAEAEEWAALRPEDLHAPEREFVEVSLAQREKRLAEERKRRAEELSQAQALAEAEHQRAEVEVRARRRLRWTAIGYAMVVLVALGSALVARQQLEAASEAVAEAQSLRLASSARMALDRDDTGLALVLAMEANRQSDPPPQAQLVLSQAAYAPGTRRVLYGHGGPVQDVAISPDSRQAISAAEDGVLIVWDLATGEAVRQLAGHDSAVRAVASGPEGRVALSGGADGTLILWDLSSNSVLHRLAGHKGAVHDVAISPDGRSALSGGADGSLIQWDLASGASTGRLAGHTGPVRSVAFSPGGARAISGSADESAILWDLDSGVIEQRFTVDTDASERGLTGPGQQAGRGWLAAFGPEGQRAITATQDGLIVWWDLGTGEQIGQAQVLEGGLLSMAPSPDGQELLLGLSNGQIARLDLSTRQSVQPLLGHRTGAETMAFAADGRQALSGSSDGSLRLWDLQSGADLGSLSKEWSATSIDVSADGRKGLMATPEGHLWLWDYEAGNPEPRFLGQATGPVAAAQFSPDGEKIAIGSGSGGKHDVLIWGAASGDEHWCFEGHRGRVWDLAFSPDGRYVASGSEDGSLRLWDLELGTGRILHDAAPQVIRSLAFAPDGEAILLGMAGGLSSAPVFGLRLVDAGTGEPIRRFEGHEGAVIDVALSPDGQLALSASMDQRSIVWQVSTGRPARHLGSGPVGAWSVAFSPDGQLAATGDAKGVIYFWNPATGANLRELVGQQPGITQMVFAPDGGTILSLAGDGTVQKWRVDGSREGLLAWIEASRQVPVLTCDQRVQYGVEPLCGETSTPGTGEP